MTLTPGRTWEKILGQQAKWGPNPDDQRLQMLYELGAWHPLFWALSWESPGVKNPDYPSGLVIMTHMHDDFEYPSPREDVDTMSWLAYEQNPYSTH
jgi:hypothetical protein